MAHHHFTDLPALLREGDLLIVNRSRVVPARLLGTTRGGGNAEVLFLYPEPSEPTQFRAMVRPGRRLAVGAVVRLDLDHSCRVVAVHADGTRTMAFDGPEPLQDTLQKLGHLPLPPYISRADGPLDRERYQTIYAQEAGSIAAPTAGLHFTERLFQALRGRGVHIRELYLHVGPGTFARVDAENIADHRVAPEPYFVPDDTAAAYAAARAQGRRVVAVGTTTVRTLETAVDGARLRPGHGTTDLVIRPGHPFRAVDALVTNFHLPKSSLLFLVSAFAGHAEIQHAYRQAIENGYRFFSYGDAMFIHGATRSRS